MHSIMSFLDCDKAHVWWWTHRILLPHDIIAVLVDINMLCNVHSGKQCTNDEFLEHIPLFLDTRL